MKKQLLSWAQNQTFSSKWDRMATTQKTTYVAAWVYQHDDNYTCHVTDLSSNNPILTKDGFKSLDEAKSFADRELKNQGYNS